jgi:hypothetical protein
MTVCQYDGRTVTVNNDRIPVIGRDLDSIADDRLPKDDQISVFSDQGLIKAALGQS